MPWLRLSVTEPENKKQPNFLFHAAFFPFHAGIVDMFLAAVICFWRIKKEAVSPMGQEENPQHIAAPRGSTKVDT